MIATDTQPQPAPQQATPTTCPHCHRDLSVTQRGKHCPPLGDKRPHPTCTWLKCACQALVDLRTRNHHHPTHDGPRDTWTCTRKATP